MLKVLLEKNVRMIWSNNGNEVWFSANDVAGELGIANIRDTLRNIDSEYKKIFKNSNVGETYIRNFKEQLPNRGENFVSEEAVYNMSFRSNKPEAKLFTKWVSTVLKQIRVEDIPDNFQIEICESKDSSVIMVSVPMTFIKVGKNEFQVIYDELITRKYWDGPVGLDVFKISWLPAECKNQWCMDQNNS